ncbi:MAG TPA: class I SAM-dependent methyltransferase [Myxococcota bacterium]|nr:class I SAM-dependent methyltransferase [Myxococcota bacterium]
MTSAEVFESLHAGLPQQGPGSDASTLRALALVLDLPAAPDVLDVGCGPGRQTLALARATGGRITAVDLSAAFLDEVARRARAAGLEGRIATRRESLDALALPDAAFDLVWSEGALYTVGFEKALRALRRLLRPGGALAATELTWLVDDPPAAARAFWREAYPPMTTREGNHRALAAAGYAPLADFALPDADWWRGYYAELEPRIAALRARTAGDPAAAAALAAAQREIELRRAFPDAYGYVFYVARRA